MRADPFTSIEEPGSESHWNFMLITVCNWSQVEGQISLYQPQSLFLFVFVLAFSLV